jgi:hypothetical protein
MEQINVMLRRTSQMMNEKSERLYQLRVRKGGEMPRNPFVE